MSKRVLVIFHLYYHDQIPYFIDKMKNIADVDWDLVVTSSNFTEDAKKIILDFKSDTQFMETENKGYDIGSFIQAVKTIDLSAYWFVIKLHTKNVDDKFDMRLNCYNLCGFRWRNTMVDAILGDKNSFGRIVRAFENERIGMAYAMSVNALSRNASVEDSIQLFDELERLGIMPVSMRFCAGTIFAVRAKALAYLQSDLVDVGMFSNTGMSHAGGTMAHSYERILTMAVTAQGYKTYLIPKNMILHLFYFLKSCVQPFLEWVFSINRFGVEQTKYLVIFGLKIKLTD